MGHLLTFEGIEGPAIEGRHGGKKGSKWSPAYSEDAKFPAD